MERRQINYDDRLGLTLRKLRAPGLLLAARGLHDEPPNIMTIGWATFGIIWGKPLCIVLVRPSRYTYRLIEACQDFSVNVPAEGMDDIVAYCGTVSGRDHAKFAEKGLTAAPSNSISSPVVAECLVHYECKVVHHNDVVPATLAPELKSAAYPTGDYHRLYYGEILRTTERADIESLLR